jgi:hypothetical protein
MRHTSEAIRQFLIEQPLSGQTVAVFCDDHDLKVPTFYSWRKKYGAAEIPVCTLPNQTYHELVEVNA